ncbi:2831_t:CDS:1, partial [Acaulospora colombiana]
MSEPSDSNDDASSFASAIDDIITQMIQNIPEQAAPPSSPVQPSSSLTGSPNIFPSTLLESPTGPPPLENTSSLLNLEVPSLLLAPRTFTPSLGRYNDPELDYLANLHEPRIPDHTESTIRNGSTPRPDLIVPRLDEESPPRDRAATTDQNFTIPPTSPMFNLLPLPLFPVSNGQDSANPTNERPRPNASTVERLLEMMRTLSIQDPEEDDNEETPTNPIERRWDREIDLWRPENIVLGPGDEDWLPPPPLPRAFNPNRRLQERAQTIIDKLETLDRDLVQKFCAMGCAGGEEGDRCTICWESFIEELDLT